jgi:hypothetical protein
MGEEEEEAAEGGEGDGLLGAGEPLEDVGGGVGGAVGGGGGGVEGATCATSTTRRLVDVIAKPCGRRVRWEGAGADGRCVCVWVACARAMCHGHVHVPHVHVCHVHVHVLDVRLRGSVRECVRAHVPVYVRLCPVPGVIASARRRTNVETVASASEKVTSSVVRTLCASVALSPMIVHSIRTEEAARETETRAGGTPAEAATRVLMSSAL